MPERRIILLEQDEHLSDALTNMFEAFGGVVKSAHTFEDAQRLIDEADPDDFDIAIIDTPRSRDATDSEDGTELIRQLRTKKSGTLLVGISGPGELPGVDVNVNPLDLAQLRMLVEAAYTEPLREAV